MGVLPEGWRVHRNRDAERDALRAKQRRAAMWRRQDRTLRLRSYWRRVRVPVIILFVVVGILAWIRILSPWPVTTTLRHIGAYHNCASARAFGLAPAARGEPGYWRHLDADNDGWACEPFPRRWY